MKKIPPFLLSIFLLAIFVATPVSAATSAGIKPNSFLYFFDTTFEKVNLFFTFNPEKKAKKALEYADERLAEAETLTDNKDSNMVKAVMENYTANIALASEKSKEVKDQQASENLLSTIADSTSKNQEVLTGVLAKVPEEAKDAILRAIEASKKEQEQAIKQIAELKGEVEKLKKELTELKKESNNPRASEVETLKKEIEELKKQQTISSKNGVVQNNQPAVIERIIEKTIVVEQKTQITPPVSQVQVLEQPSVSDTASNTRKIERQAFDTFWQNTQKAMNELSEATKYLTNALSSASGSTGSVAATYAQNAIDACNSSYQLNLNNSIPNLPFSSDLSDVNKLIGRLGTICKQEAQATQESFKYLTDIHSDSYNPYKAKDLIAEAARLREQFSDIWKNQLSPALDKMVNDVDAYF